jgi:outer membrane protein assembly factor BamD
MMRIAILTLLLLAVPARAQAGPDSDMVAGRYYVSNRDHTAALYRFKIVVIHHQHTRHLEETLARLAEAYLAVDVASEAQNVVAVLVRKFPDGRRSAEARQILKAAGLEPIEDEMSWVSRTLR